MANKLELLSKIDDTEAEILSNDRFIKYIFSGGDNETSRLYIAVGDDSSIQDILQSVFAVINTVYAGIQKGPNGQKNAKVFRDNLKMRVNSEEFWIENGEMISYRLREGTDQNRFS